ncbi:MAG: 50S ribosomal protein L15 [Dehalococcoidia bacterium]
MQQHELRQPAGATHKRKRVGRGNASGHGTYATRGLKGQKARSGGGVRVGFEGGQLPFIRRMARKRGFTNRFRVDYEEVNVGKLARFSANAEVNEQALRDARLVRGGRPIKILGVGDLSVALTVEAASFSQSARTKIEAAGGTVRWLNGEPQPKEPVEPAPKAKRAKTPKPETTAGKAASKTDKAASKVEEEQDSAGSDEEQEEASDGAGG